MFMQFDYFFVSFSIFKVQMIKKTAKALVRHINQVMTSLNFINNLAAKVLFSRSEFVFPRIPVHI